MTWKQPLLLGAAAAEAHAFLDARMDHLYWAMCQDRGHLLAPPVSASQALQDLNAALDALSLADIRQHMMAPEPRDSIYERMLDLKIKREAELAQRKSQQTKVQEPVDDREPEQAQ